MDILIRQVEGQIGIFGAPFLWVALFVASSVLIIWRLELMIQRGVQGTVLGTLFMPYFSGLGNLIFVLLVLRENGSGEDVAMNCWTNNVTNLCLLIPLPALFGGLSLQARSKAQKTQRESRINRLSLHLTLLAMAFFSLVVWSLGQDGSIDRFDGVTLIGLFLFWQCFHVFEVLKDTTRAGSHWHPLILLDLLLILVGSFITLLSVEGVVDAILKSENKWVSPARLGLLTGWMMVLPNAVLAVYYTYRRRADVVYSSQVGDGHICIPLCIGLYAVFQAMPMSERLKDGLLFITSACLLHLLTVVLFKGLPKWIAGLFVAAYGYALYTLMQ